MSGLNAYLEHTNTLDFCVSCHDMSQTVYPEYQASGHYVNHEGVRVVCSDCHVPRAFLPKILRKISSIREVYHAWAGTIDDKERFEARRLQLAEKVWATMQETNSRECRHCHSFEAMAFEKQQEIAQSVHPMAFDSGMTCIDCHKGIAHRLPEGY